MTGVQTCALPIFYTGPTRTGAAVVAAQNADAAAEPKPHRGKKARLASSKPDAAATPKTDAKSGKEPKQAAKEDAKPAVKHANAKPDAATAADSTAAKPAKPKAAAKTTSAKTTAAKTTATKPTPKGSSGDTKPAG